MELTAEGTGCPARLALGWGTLPAGYPGELAKDRFRWGEREMTQSINQIKTVTSPPKNSISPIF